jgi:deazaflavin-dependent oxidoreductase (nitroreductase family)
VPEADGPQEAKPHVARGGFVSLVLRSPLHRLMSGSTALITVTGRKTGTTYTFPVQYVRNGDTVWIIPGRPERKTWWRNLTRPAPVTLCLRGEDVEAEAQASVGAEEPSVVEEGIHVFLARFPRAAKTLGIKRRPDGGFGEEDVERAAKNAVVVRARVPRPR